MTEWLQAIDREYLGDYILGGGGSVKFAIGPAASVRRAFDELESMAIRREFVFIELGAAETNLNRSDHIFFDIAKHIDWEGLARNYIVSAFEKHGVSLAYYGNPIDFTAAAEPPGLDESVLRGYLRETLLQLYQDYAMCQEFRLAMIQLCRAEVAGLENSAEAVKRWLRGELKKVSEVKSAKLFQKIGRQNARLMLQSLAYWMRRNGAPGLVLTIDLARCLENVKKADRGPGYYYSSSALTEVYEMLRQLIDGSSSFEGMLIAIFAPAAFLSDEKRGVDRYQALKMRIFDDVRTHGRQNVLAPLVRLGEQAA